MLALHLTLSELIHINRCRVYMQVYLYSDIITADGKQIETWCISSPEHHRTSKWSWPHIPLPTPHSWKIWKKFIKQLQRSWITNGQRLGAWLTDTHQNWPNQIQQIKIPNLPRLIPTPTSFRSYMETIPRYQQIILGELSYPTEEDITLLFQDIGQGLAIGASDAAFHSLTGTATHSYILQGTATGTKIQGNATTPGIHSQMTPFRAEFFGHHSTYLILHHIVYYYHNLLNFPIRPTSIIHNSIPIFQTYTDNKKVANTMSQLTLPKYATNLKYAIRDEADIIMETHALVKQIPFEARIENYGSM